MRKIFCEYVKKSLILLLLMMGGYPPKNLLINFKIIVFKVFLVSCNYKNQTVLSSSSNFKECAFLSKQAGIQKPRYDEKVV